MDGLPGTPDNLNLSPEGNILIALVSVRLPGEFDPLELMFNHPWLRKIAIRIMHLAKFPFDVVSKFYDFPLFRQIGSHVIPILILILSNVIFFFKVCFRREQFILFLGHEFKPIGACFAPVLYYR